MAFDDNEYLDFNSLVGVISNAHGTLSANAAKAVNISLTLRNWLIGYYISEYKLKGSDRAKYGVSLFSELSKELKSLNVSGTGRRQLYNYLAFYHAYPEIVRTVTAQLDGQIPYVRRISEKVLTPSAQLEIPPMELVEKLSYSHLELLTNADEELKRRFYEAECIRGNWSVRELKRQIASQYYERSCLSKDKKKLSEIAKAGAERSTLAQTIKDPYVFDFLGLRPTDVMLETDLENALLDRLQDFLLELGHGFCFEARQKRILIGGEHYFVDMVFYHRILKCHVLIELKVEDFNHENIGQLNTYVNWFRANEMSKDDNPPVGILLCTRKNSALVRYALAGMDNQLFVSKYQLELPRKEEIEKFLEEQVAYEIP